MTRFYQALVAALLCFGVAAPAQTDAESPWIPLSVVMNELSADPAFVDAVLPIDGREHPRPEVARVLGSLPVENPSELPLPELRRDIELVKAAWLRGELEYTGSWPAWAWMAAGAGVVVTMYIWASRWRRHNRRPH